MKKVGLSLSFGAALLMGAAIAGDKDRDKTSAEDPRPGPEIDRICFGRSINGWKNVNGYGDAVLLQKGVNDWYLVEVSSHCRARDFKFAQTIGLESRPGGGCLTDNDYILVEGTNRFKNRCYIKSIREWNDDLPDEDEEDE